tara:strand:+ start:548 stop:1240 length:693 start_codon:yes stop_codon:yes gene_type:complete
MSDCNTISIGTATAQTSMKINVTPSHAFNFMGNLQQGASFSPQNVEDILLSPGSVQFQTTSGSVPSSTIGGIVIQQNVNIQVGEESQSLVPQLLTAFQYHFDNFVLESSSSFEKGDIIFFKLGTNGYSSTIEKADILNTEKGAYNNLFIFISYESQRLTVMHKGYIEIPNSKIETWSVGRTLYLNNENILHINPATVSGGWVRSLGFCVPNNENKKFIWFDPDTTYLKRL